jgi:flagellar basal body-associated protein FliL
MYHTQQKEVMRKYQTGEIMLLMMVVMLVVMLAVVLFSNGHMGMMWHGEHSKNRATPPQSESPPASPRVLPEQRI